MPIATLFLLLTQGLKLLAWAAGEEYIPHNAQLEGARILSHRNDARSERVDDDIDVLLVGSSRTLAAYSPRVVADELASHWDVETGLTGGNLGLSDYPALARRLVQGSTPRLVVLEFSPHLLSQATDQRGSLKGANSALNAYRRRVAVTEMYVSGLFGGLVGIEGSIRVRPGDLRFIRFFLAVHDEEGVTLTRLYYLLRAVDGYAQQLRPDGQVYYYSYLPDRRAADLIKPVTRLRGGDNYRILSADVNPKQIKGFTMVAEAVDRGGGQIVVVRPPVDHTLYAMENEQKEAPISEVRFLLASMGVPYLDMNPHAYSTADLSHVDWFDTAELSRALAARIAPNLEFARNGHAVGQ